MIVMLVAVMTVLVAVAVATALLQQFQVTRYPEYNTVNGASLKQAIAEPREHSARDSEKTLGRTLKPKHWKGGVGFETRVSRPVHTIKCLKP